MLAGFLFVLFRTLLPIGDVPAAIQSSMQAEGSSPFTGKGVEGGGRVCDSGLRIYPHYIDWNTTYSNCHHTPYQTISSTQTAYIYRLKPADKKCKYRVLIVRNLGTGEGWQSIAFASEAAWHRSDPGQLSCGPLF